MVQLSDRVWGPDVSSWQGNVDWSAVRADGASFGIVKISEGIAYKNPFAPKSWEDMGNLGMVRVQYHYARPSLYKAQSEADWFLAQMLPLAPGDIVALDLESDYRDSPLQDSGQWAYDWLTYVEKNIGYPPMFYSNAGVIGDPGQGFRNHPDMGIHNGLWLASWGEVFPSPVAPWDVVALWQFTNQGNVGGIQGYVDLNMFNGTLEAMKSYGKPAPVQIPDTGGDAEVTHAQLDALFARFDNLDVEFRALLTEARELLERFG